MKTLRTIFPILFVLILSNCQYNDVRPSGTQQQLISNWQVVLPDNTPVAEEWGLYYVLSVKIYPDNTFKVNLSTNPDNPSVGKTGTWKLDGNKITFYEEMQDPTLGLMSSTTTFTYSFDQSGRLILVNDDLTILHNRLSN